MTIGQPRRRGKGKCVKACTATKDHEEFLEIDLYEGERKETSKERDRCNEVDSLFSMFSTDERYRSVIGPWLFFSFRPPLCGAAFLSRVVLSDASFSSFLSFSRGIMRPSCRELLRLYPFFFSRTSRSYVKCRRTLASLSIARLWELSFNFFSDARYKYEKAFYKVHICYIHVI